MAGPGSGSWRATLAALVTAGALLAGCTAHVRADVGAGAGTATATRGATPAPVPQPDPTATAPGGVRPPDPTTHAAPGVPVGPDAPLPVPGFLSSIGPVTAELAARMSSSWRPGCPVPLADLRYVTVTHRTFDGTTATGELVVHADVAEGLVGVFADLFDQGYPVRSMRLVDDFGGDDDASMAADNTSAFNCRAVTGGSAWSEHSYGRALDLNPVENPYVRGDFVAPPGGRAFLDRPSAPGVLHAGDAAVTAFAAAGWRWGGEWTRPVDYQHFSTTGR